MADAFLLPGCVSCGAVNSCVKTHVASVALCAQCFSDWPNYLGEISLQGLRRYALWPYSGTVRRLLVQAKDTPYCAQAWALRRAAVGALQDKFPRHAVWCVTPPSRRRQRADWYLPKFLALAMARSRGRPLRRLLRRRQQRQNQSVLSGAERRTNLDGLFVFRGHVVPEVVVLLDDVSTTGATLLEAARALRAAGVKEVIAVCIAVVE